MLEDLKIEIYNGVLMNGGYMSGYMPDDKLDGLFENIYNTAYNQALEDAADIERAIHYKGEVFVNRNAILSLKKNEE